MDQNATFQKVKGFLDIYGVDCVYLDKVESSFDDIMSLFDVREMRLPILEHTAVFARGVGSTTDVVEKEMFTFIDRESASRTGDQLSLRPEGTAGLVRSYIENGLYSPLTLKKYYYVGPMFRRERPQKGRYRQFTQAGVEFLGSESPLVDADVINILATFFSRIGLSSYVQLEINSIGCNVCRPPYQEKLLKYLLSNVDGLCDDCKRRIKVNPMRILDCKIDSCKKIASNAPLIIDHLCDNCHNHFDGVKHFLSVLNIDYVLNPFIVRGLDYYVRTAFEMVTKKLGSASAVAAGGRYDGLVETLGGPQIPGIGFAIGVERVVELMKIMDDENNSNVDIPCPSVFIITFGGKTLDAGVRLMSKLRENSISAVLDYDVKGMKNQMKQADRSGATYAVIIGDDEVSEGFYTLRDLTSSHQQKINEIDLIQKILSSRN